MTVRLSLLSEPSVRRPGDEQPIALALRDAALLAWLALVGPTTRAQLAALLWHGQDDDQARNSLRQRIFQLRRQVGEDMVFGHTVLQLSLNIEHDLDAGWGLLGNLQLPECPAIDGWLVATRALRYRQQRSSLVKQLSALEGASEHAAALPLATVLAHIEPMSEQAHRRLMRLQALTGDRAGAQRTYQHLEARLREGLNMAPDEATQNLRHAIASGDTLPVTAPTQLEQQLQALSPDALTLLRLLAVSGDGFGLAMAQFVLQKHVLQLSDAWRELSLLHLIEGDRLASTALREQVLALVPKTIADHVREQILAFRNQEHPQH
jgi:DNA-binding SARP family transcriptional activator